MIQSSLRELFGKKIPKTGVISANQFMKISSHIIRLVGMMVEYSDMGTNYAQSHLDHLGILAVIVVLGLIDLAHVNNILRDNIWCLSSPGLG